MTRYDEVCTGLRANPRRFLVTGAAGFIGSHLVESLLELGQTVVALDDFSTGSRSNLEAITSGRARAQAMKAFHFIQGDIRDAGTCAEAMRGVEVIFHEAALASVPRSMKDPLSTHAVNVDGFVNVLLAAHSAGVRRIVYASSSSVYGDEEAQPKTEARIGNPLSPYAATKRIDEVYAGTFRRSHGIDSVGLRYFNVFGPRQDPAGPYAAVIPRWVENLFAGRPCVAFGDGTSSRDFCYVANVIQANLLAASAPRTEHEVFNVACGARTTLLQLFAIIREAAARHQRAIETAELTFDAPRPGDIPHSLASIDRAKAAWGYEPSYDLARGMDETVAWYAKRASAPHRGDGHGIRHASLAEEAS